ncbi:hypothetical protein [Brevibacterium sp.]|uniref:hypothetical protein n=1 Tax=Brevibacterium sp. TaxID=1701 RepID=UPI0025C673BF|nr:hypothetical protein [Brevibacterium sp.]
MSHPISSSTVLPIESVHDYEGADHDRLAGRFGPDAVAFDGESGARLSAARVLEFRERLNGLIAEFFSPEAAEWTSPVKYGFRWILMPVDTAPLEDSRADR